MRKTAAICIGSVLLLTGAVPPLPASAKGVTTDTQRYYDAWKETYLRKNPYVKDEDQYYVFYGEETYAQAQETVPVTVSEAHGYGMLIEVMMADYDSEAHAVFDGMYRYYQAHLSEIGPHLMAWQQSDNGTALIDTDGADSAMDGDLDIAYALLTADMVWGSDGAINYRQAAELMIADIMEYEVNRTRWIPQLGDWAHDEEKEQQPQNPAGAAGFFPQEEPAYCNAFRSSDLMPQHFYVFSKVTGDKRWDTLYRQTNYIVHTFTDFNVICLLPDFCVQNHVGGWSGAPANFLEGEFDGHYSYNACRTPWRIGTEALIGKAPEAQKYAECVNTMLKKSAKGDPKNIRAGYTVTGTPLVSYGDLCFTAPLMISAAAAGDTEWHDAIRREVLDTGMDSYYGNTIAMLCLITDDGGWLVPEEAADPTGDLNKDGKTDAADMQLLQDWLLCKPDTAIAAWRAGDMNGNGKLDAADLSAIRHILYQEYLAAHALSDIGAIFDAVRNAKPGDEIRVAPGTYDFTTYEGAQKIDTKAAGTAEAPIVLAALDPENPPVFTGSSPENGYVFHIQGDYWILDHLVCTTAQKGIVLDHSDHTVIRNCEVMNTGAEAIAIRDGSSDCVVQSCSIHDTGKVTPGYGEGVYIGSAYTTTGFDYKCDNNKVLRCKFWRVAAEHVDVKEYTTGTEIAECSFQGSGMTGENYAGSFIDIAGNNCYVHDNVGYRCQNPQIVAAIEIHEQVEGWGYHHVIENNTFYLEQEYGVPDPTRRIYVVDGWFSDFTVKNNRVDYGDPDQTSAVPAKPEHYNSDHVTFAD